MCAYLEYHLLAELPTHADVEEAARRIDEANIELADIALRRPSLDDVFLSLTADPSETHALSHLASEAMR